MVILVSPARLLAFHVPGETHSGSEWKLHVRKETRSLRKLKILPQVLCNRSGFDEHTYAQNVRLPGSVYLCNVIWYCADHLCNWAGGIPLERGPSDKAAM